MQEPVAWHSSFVTPLFVVFLVSLVRGFLEEIRNAWLFFLRGIRSWVALFGKNCFGEVSHVDVLFRCLFFWIARLLTLFLVLLLSRRDRLIRFKIILK